ncbi:MAG: arsenic resistance N-acetyltransferase ArsN2 [Paludibacter sp.]|nr:arsenic resistance N-acetyltransferase ArsN2 [Paludibacter sp.]
MDSNNILYRIPDPKDYPAIQKLLTESSLPVEDIVPGIQKFIVAESEGRIIGCSGFEAYGKTALFRSLAVHLNYRNLKIGELLTGKAMDLAGSNGIREFYLLTNTAEGFFRNRGWDVVDRKEVPSELTNSTEFASICPSSAVCMKYKFLF